jgi:hypothetical protein
MIKLFLMRTGLASAQIQAVMRPPKPLHRNVHRSSTAIAKRI